MSSNWALRTAGVAILASLVGFWLPDGIAWMSSILLDAPLTVDANARAAAVIATVSFSLVVEHVRLVQDQLSQQRNAINQIVTVRLDDEVMNSFARSLTALGITAVTLPARQIRSVATAYGEFASLVAGLTQLSAPLRGGVAMWLAGPVADVRDEMRRLQSKEGINVSLRTHIEVSRAILEEGVRSYTQINLQAYHVDAEWTQDWRDFVRWVSNNEQRSLRYIVLADANYLQSEHQRLLSMQRFLSKHGAALQVCERETVVESVGPFVLDHNVEVFDQSVLKAQAIPANTYRGGVSLAMSLVDAAAWPELAKLCTAIQHAAHRFRP